MVGESNRILRRKGVEVPVYYFFRGDFACVDLFASLIYVNVADEGSDEFLFGPTESTAFKRAVIQLIHGTKLDN